MRSNEFIGNNGGNTASTEAKTERSHDSNKSGKIYVVGIGPGDFQHMTARAKDVWQEVDVVAGYKTYIDIIRPLLSDKQVVSTGMRQELDRCREVVKLAQEGKKVALVSSGDAGIYGMAGILIECLEEAGCIDMPLEIIPGVSASNAAASMLGAPLMHDFVTISLSDLLTPWDLILKRARLAAEGDYVIAIYNPKSKGRQEHIEKVREILLEYRSPDTPVGIVREALRGESKVTISNLQDFTKEEIDMLTTVIVGNSNTKVIGPYMVTPRGYKL